MLVYFNGRFLPKEEVRISPDDRGFLFADGIYEVIRSYGGRLFRSEDHFRRMGRSLSALRLEAPPAETFAGIAEHLMQANDLSDALLYIQITRGAAPRRHAFPDGDTPPTIYAAASPVTPKQRQHENGVGVILVPDQRWARCDVKSVALLPNVMASQRARDHDALEALFVRDGAVTEGTHTNVCAVLDGELRTYPRTNYILPGITRAVVLELCGDLGLPFDETPILEHELDHVDELMILGTSTEVTPVVQVDGRPVGTGKPGPLTQKLQRAFREVTRDGGD